MTLPIESLDRSYFLTRCDGKYPGRRREEMIGNTIMTICLTAICLIYVDPCGADILPSGSSPPAIEFNHFPDRLYAFVWRNWELFSLERMAKVLETTPKNISAMGESMGLPPHVTPPDKYEQLGYLSIIRRNWHILNYDQLLTLLDWDVEKLAFTLREDDFLWIKLGSLKPSCSRLCYSPPGESVKKRCAEIKVVVSSHFKRQIERPWRPRFDFINDMSSVDMPSKATGPRDGKEPIRFLYSYFGVFGDPLLHPELDPYPDELLGGLAESGVNGVWLHVVLRQLAPSKRFPEFGKDHAIRIRGLNRLVNRAKNYGIKIYLYINEPRAMPGTFFTGRDGIRGVHEGDHFSLCTSTSEVQEWLKKSLGYVFKQVPGLGGVFTITGSENLTNCYSHSRNAAGCPRCSERSGPDVIAEVNRTIAAGVWEGNPDAAVIIWDWGWPDGTSTGWGQPDWAGKIIKALPDDVYLMCVSEWGKGIQRGGVSSTVGEYSISSVGPGPRAKRHWTLAKSRGLKTIAKVQVNSSWELSGYRATMIGFPYDDVESWRAVYPADVLAGQFEKMASEWQKGISSFERAIPKITVTHQYTNIQEDLRIAKAVNLHFKSVSNQIRFILVRNKILSSSPDKEQQKNHLQTIRAVVMDEILNAKHLFVLTQDDPRIGFEASNQYYYLPLDLVEKVINCEYILSNWLPLQMEGATVPENKHTL